MLTKDGNHIFCVKNDNFNGVLTIGVVHGDEPQRKYLIESYMRANKDSKLAIIPVLNPDGMAKNSSGKYDCFFKDNDMYFVDLYNR